ncbi:MAG: hypothetical protein IJ761_07425 [Bacteroidales bacterium]|nr:hypothetical protein [Bacteroidales bacterium]
MKMSYPYQTEVLLLLYSPFQQLDIYDTVGVEKKVAATICPVRDSFEMESHILLMKVLDNRDGMLCAVVMMDNFMLEEDEKGYDKYDEKCEMWKDTSYLGWINKDNLGAIPLPDEDHVIELYNDVNDESCAICVDWNNDELPDMFRVVDVDVNSVWVQILWTDNKRYWIPPKHQCTQIFSGCTGA